MNTGSGLSVAITQQATRDTAGAGSIITASVAAGSDAGGVVGGGVGGWVSWCVRKWSVYENKIKRD